MTSVEVCPAEQPVCSTCNTAADIRHIDWSGVGSHVISLGAFSIVLFWKATLVSSWLVLTKELRCLISNWYCLMSFYFSFAWMEAQITFLLCLYSQQCWWASVTDWLGWIVVKSWLTENCCSSVMVSQTPLHCSKCSFMTVPELKWLLAQAFGAAFHVKGEVERRAPSGLLNWLILGHWPQLPITLTAGALLPLWLLMSGSWDIVVHLLLPAFNQPSPLPIARACMTADQCWS